jgi:hypothetical protein
MRDHLYDRERDRERERERHTEGGREMWCLAGERHFALAAVDEARWGGSAKLQEVLEAN